MTARPANTGEDSVSRKISVSQLKPGMYICDLGADWLSHSFLRNRFPVDDETVIRRITESGIREVYIDPSRGIDVDDAPTGEEVQAAVVGEMIDVARRAPPVCRTTAREEIVHARLTAREADKVVRNTMADVRMGLQVESEKIEPIVDRITRSILRNASALIHLTRIKNKDDYTFQHSVAVCSLLVAFGRALGMEAQVLRWIGIGALLHDIGKVRVSDAILNKPGPLTEPEFERMKDHVSEGVNILRQGNGFHASSILVTEHHHERYDGTGYPARLAGDTISQVGQMAAICDVYDAITSARIYRRPMAPHEAMAKLFEWSRFHFNPDLVHQFLRVIGIYPVGALVMLESGRLAVVLEQSENNLLQPVVRAFYDTRHLHVIAPVVIDLSRGLGHGGGDRIVGHERPERWGIDLARFL